MKTALIVMALCASACAPSAKEVARARTATYSCDQRQVFDAMRSALRGRMPLRMMDRTTGRIVTAYVWHTYDGTAKNGALVPRQDGDRGLSITAQMHRTGDAWRVAAEPRVIAQVTGGPRAQRLTRDDGDWPPWVDNKVDAFLVKLRRELSGCEVQAAP